MYKQANTLLIQGSLYKIKIDQAYTSQVITYKHKLDARRSLQKRCFILANTALIKSKKKRKDAVKSVLIKA
jgi:hypothetical protein